MPRLLVLALVLSTSACLFQPTSDPGGADAANDHDAPTVSDAGPDDAAHPTWDATVTDDATRPDAHTTDVWTGDATTEPDMGPPDDAIVRTTAGLVSHYIFADSLNDRVRSNAPLASLQRDNGRAFGYAMFPGNTYDDVLSGEDFALEANVYVDGNGILLQCSGEVFFEVNTAAAGTGAAHHASLSVAFGTKDFTVPDALVRSGRTHIAWVRENMIGRLYIRGALVAAVELPNVDTHGCALGESGQTGRPNIQYESIALYNRALSPGEVAMHALAGPGAVPTVDYELTDLAVRVHARTGVSSSALRSRSVTIVDGSVADVLEGEFALGSKILMRFGDFHGDKGVPGEVVSSRLHLLGPLQTSGAALKVYPMIRVWNDHATWTEATENQLWNSPGAIGSFDRDSHVAEAQVTEHTVLAVDLDVTSLVTEWVDDDHNNNGIQIECDTCGGSVFPAVATSAGRPTFVTISKAARPDPPSAPMVTYDANYSWPDYNSTVEMEVYQGGRLIARVPTNSWAARGDVDNTPLTFIAVDAWGQRSVRVTP